MRAVRASRLLAFAGLGLFVIGCAPPQETGGTGYNNTTDPTNGGATYLSSAACRACHPSIDAVQQIHGHGHMLTAVEGQPPSYPAQATRAGVPNPPSGYAWSDIAYVLGGYTKTANFINIDGYLLTTGATGEDTQFDLSFPANGSPAHFVPYEASLTGNKAYEYACFACQTTGPASQKTSAPQFQENRPGLPGTLIEAGVPCDACHGPGTHHVPNPSARDIYVNTSAARAGSAIRERTGALR